MSNTLLISHSRETGTHHFWAWDPDGGDKSLRKVETKSTIPPLGSGYLLTTVGSFLLFYKPPSYVSEDGKAYVDYTLLKLEMTVAGPQLSLAQQANFYWDKFTGGYSYTNDPYGKQITDLQLIGITGYVLSRLSTPGRSSFGLWNFDAYNDMPGSGEDPIHVSLADPDAFPTIAADDVLIPIQNYVVVVNWTSKTWRVFSFDPQLPNPLSYPEVAGGALPSGLHKEIVAVGDHLLARTPGETSHAIYEFCPSNPFSNPKKGKLPSSFPSDVSTTLTGLHPKTQIKPELAGVPGTMDFMRSNIKHVVYYVLESRSFDSVVGWLYDKQSAANINWVGAPVGTAFEGASTSNSNEDAGKKKYYQNQFKEGAVSDAFILSSPSIDPFHGTPDAIRQQWSGGYASYSAKHAADMGGFVLNNGNAEIMETFSPAQLGILNGLAASYAVSDMWFSSEAGGTTTNRATMASGSAYNITTSYEGDDAYAIFSEETRRQSLWKVLANNGISDWAIYYSVLWEEEPYTYHLFLEGQIPSVDEYSGQYVQPIASFIAAAKAGTLPAFSFLEPVWVSGTEFTSYHPKGDILPGEQALQNIFEALMGGPAWENTVLVVSFSKGGGMYDHVPAQAMKKAWPNDGNDGYEFDTTGTRVPTLVISPLVKKNTVFRAEGETPYDATSLAATVLSWFGVPRCRWGMGDRIAAAPTFEGVFQLATPRTDTPTLTRAIDKTYPTTAKIPVAAPLPISSSWAGPAINPTWTDPDNWSPKNLPTDVATFGAAGATTVTFSFAEPQTVNEVVFASGAQAYTLLFDEEKPDAATLSIAGTGVMNNSNNVQIFNVQASNQTTTQIQLAFLNEASAARAGSKPITYKVAPTTPDSQSGGIIAFNQKSSAGSANFEVSVGSRPPGDYSTVGAEVRFLHHSTASTATFTVSGTTGSDTDTFGNVVFHNFATAANATFTNVGGTLGDGGNTQFFEQATAAEATINNQGATQDGGNGGDVAFDGTATAGSATITNEAASAGYGGVTSFNNNSPFMAPSVGATAGNAKIVNQGGAVGQSGAGGHTEFTGIYGAGNGGAATIDNEGSATAVPSSGGYTLFATNGSWPYAIPTAGQATITNHPAVSSGAVSGSTRFTHQNYKDPKAVSTNVGPTAGNATILNKGGTLAGAAGGTTTFDYMATAGSATLTADGGTNGGGPGTIFFSRSADGGNAVIKLLGGVMDTTASTRPKLNVGALTMHEGTIACEVGNTTPTIVVAGAFTLASAKADFTFALAPSKAMPTDPVVLLEAAALATMKATQFSGSLAGAKTHFEINGTQLQVTFTPTS